MEGRCAVETWAEFGTSGTPCTPWLKVGFGTDVLLCTGIDEVYVFCSRERKLTAVIACPGPVTDLVESHDTQFLYVACASGVYCVSSRLLGSRAGSSPADASPGPAELKLSPELLAFAEEGVLSLLLVGSVLLTLSQRDSSWILTQYRTSDHQLLRSVRVPLVSGVESGAKTGRRRRPLLTCVQPPSPAASPPASDGRSRLEPLLFKLLFGIDAALAKSPVVLCGLPDGRLCFLPLRPVGSRLAVLHSLEQPVAFVGASGATDAGGGPARCLVAVGEQGRVVLIKSDKGGSEGGGGRADFIEGCVPGPVTCGCVDEKRLYYSTGSDLLVLDLPEESPEREGPSAEKARVTRAALRSPSSLNVCRVLALAEPTCNAAGEVELLGLSARGRLQRITLPVHREDAAWTEAASTRGGVRDLLSAIGDVCERAAVLKAAVKSKNHILRRLNQVLSVSFLLTADAAERDKPIGCRATAGWSRLLEEDSMTLTCVLDNSSPYVLERGWTLSVAASPLSAPPAAGGRRPCAHFSFPFHGLHPGETLEVSLPLATAGQSPFPVTVSCSLTFSLAGLLGDEAAAAAAVLPGARPGCVSLPLCTLTVDWLHALRVTSPAHGKAPSQSSNAPDAVRAFLRSRRASGGGRGAAAGERERHAASVRVSSESLRDAPALRGSRVDGEGPRNLGLSLLEWLLSEDRGGVSAGRVRGDGDAPRRSAVHGRDPSGHPVQLTAREVEVAEERRTGDEETLAAVEVQVESSSVAAVCGLHHAVLTRVQALLQTAPERAAPATRTQRLGLRGDLRRAERLLQQIQQSRISGAFGVGVSTGRVGQSLLSVYRELRENPPLMM